MTVYGYARVSTADQKDALENQTRLLLGRGVDQVNLVVEVGSTRGALPVRDKLIGRLQPEDVIMAYKLDRIGRSMTDLRATVDCIIGKGASFQSLDGILVGPDDNTVGKLIFNIMAAIAEWERETIRDRMMEGVARAKRAGKYKGRLPALRDVPTDELTAIVRSLGAARAAKKYSVARRTVYNECARRGISLK